MEGQDLTLRLTMPGNAIPIKRKIELILLATVASGVLMAWVAFAWNDYRLVRDGLELRMQAHARVVANAAEMSIQRGDLGHLGRMVDALASDPAVRQATIMGPYGRVWAKFDRSVQLGEQQRSGDDITKAVTARIDWREGKQGRVTIRASQSEIAERFYYDAKVAGVVLLGALVLGIAIASRLARGLSAPIESLSNAVRQISQTSDYSLRTPVPSDDELGRLAADFNQMLAEIERRDRRLESEVLERTTELQQSNVELMNEVAERASTETKLRQSEQRFKNAFDNAPVGMVLQDEDRAVLQANQAFIDLVGYSPEHLVENGIREILHPDDRDLGLFQYHELRAGNLDSYSLELRYIHRDESVIRVLAHTSAVRDSDGRFCYSIAQVQDITEAYQLSEKLSFQATHDPLTGLYNRREFEARIDFALHSAQNHRREHAVCYLDLDQFKVINDTCGHTAGDELLRQITSVLETRIRSSDTLARLGGDEFGLLMEGCPLEKSQRTAESLREAIEDFQFVWDDKRFRVGVSIGVVPINAESASVTEVLQHADTACFAAKDMGRNRIHVYLREDAELARRHGEMQWVTRIQGALESDDFRLYLQSIVPVKSDRDAHEHYEVLIRMNDESGCDIPPGAFLPAAERYNLSPRVDRWVLKHLLAWLGENREELDRIDMISVNLSGLTVADPSFLNFVTALLEDSYVPNTKICFEITETAVISNLAQATRFLSTLKELGCMFALDDFGSGLSSFAYLKSLPVDYLKIDGMFVRDIFSDPIDRALVKSINDVGKVMGKKTIAEFVENDEVREILAELGVDYAQGYGIGKPFPMENLIEEQGLIAVNG